MPHKGGRKRATPRKAYAQKAAQKQAGTRGTPRQSAQSNDVKGSPFFSMSEAARNTGHRGDWGEKKLRYSRIEFVTATSAETAFRTTDKPQPVHEDRQHNINQTTVEHTTEKGDQGERATASGLSIRDDREDGGKSEPLSVGLGAKTPPTAQPAFFIDTEGDPALKPAAIPSKSVPQIPDHDDEDNDSDSSEDVVLFAGRNNPTNGRRSSPRRSQAVRIVEEDISAISLEDRGLAGKTSGAQTARLAGSSSKSGTASPRVEEEAMEDYVANIKAQDNEDHVAGMVGFASGTFATQTETDEENGSNEEDSDDSDDDYEDELGSDENEEASDNDAFRERVNSEDEAPDETRLDQATSAMSDEQLARRLAKQEELGLGSNEVLLWGEDDMADALAEEIVEEEEFSLEVLRTAAQRLTDQQGKRSKKRNKSLLPQMLDEYDIQGDDYGAFDIMDLERPSLQRRNKGSKKLPFQLSDSELEAKMEMAWENDRSAKKQRKMEREMLRAQGLLGGGENTHLKAKYGLSGITMEEVRYEIEEFLLSSKNELHMAPMDKQSRKVVHEIANRLNMKSKSLGSGFERYPCLYKKGHKTPPFDAAAVDAIIARFNGRGGRSKMSHSSRVNKGIGRAHFGRGGGGGVTSGVSYRDGETVGASAPALGEGNRGHAMLSKMGWTHGTGLGALNNKGALEPVSHVVKSTKAGLG